MLQLTRHIGPTTVPLIATLVTTRLLLLSFLIAAHGVFDSTLFQQIPVKRYPSNQ